MLYVLELQSTVCVPLALNAKPAFWRVDEHIDAALLLAPTSVRLRQRVIEDGPVDSGTHVFEGPIVGGFRNLELHAVHLPPRGYQNKYS